MSEKVEEKEAKVEEKPFDMKEVLIEGCVDPKAREVISQMLERRLAELDAGGLQAKFIMKLQNELGAMPTCEEMFSAKKK